MTPDVDFGLLPFAHALAIRDALKLSQPEVSCGCPECRVCGVPAQTLAWVELRLAQTKVDV